MLLWCTHYGYKGLGVSFDEEVGKETEGGWRKEEGFGLTRTTMGCPRRCLGKSGMTNCVFVIQGTALCFSQGQSRSGKLTKRE